MKARSNLNAILISSALILCAAAPAPESAAPGKITQAILGEQDVPTPEITAEGLEKILVEGSIPVLDVRSPREYSIGHIPGSINIYEKEAAEILKRYPDRSSTLILYCNGPFCGKSKRVSADLVKAGYTRIWRYQLGIPIWRALGRIVQTDLDGVRYFRDGDKTTVFVDARTRESFQKETMSKAVNVRSGEADQANEPADGRLPHFDKGTRVVVFAETAAEARTVADEIAKKAYWNTSYFGGTASALKTAGLFEKRN